MPGPIHILTDKPISPILSVFAAACYDELQREAVIWRDCASGDCEAIVSVLIPKETIEDTVRVNYFTLRQGRPAFFMRGSTMWATLIRYSNPSVVVGSPGDPDLIPRAIKMLADSGWLWTSFGKLMR